MTARRRIGLLFIGLLAVVSILGREAVLELFEAYDHILNKIAFALLGMWRGLPPTITHDVVMGLGFALFGLAAVLLPAALGVRRGWVAIGLVFTALNAIWWYSVESNVASRMGQDMMHTVRISAFSTYIADSIGSFLGAFLGEWSILAFRKDHGEVFSDKAEEGKSTI